MYEDLVDVYVEYWVNKIDVKRCENYYYFFI